MNLNESPGLQTLDGSHDGRVRLGTGRRIIGIGGERGGGGEGIAETEGEITRGTVTSNGDQSGGDQSGIPPYETVPNNSSDNSEGEGNKREAIRARGAIAEVKFEDGIAEHVIDRGAIDRELNLSESESVREGEKEEVKKEEEEERRRKEEEEEAEKEEDKVFRFDDEEEEEKEEGRKGDKRHAGQGIGMVAGSSSTEAQGAAAVKYPSVERVRSCEGVAEDDIVLRKLLSPTPLKLTPKTLPANLEWPQGWKHQPGVALQTFCSPEEGKWAAAHATNLRYRAFHLFLRSLDFEGTVILADPTDVLFLANPFPTLNDMSFHLYTGSTTYPTHGVRFLPPEHKRLATCYGTRLAFSLAKSRIITSGFVAGTMSQVPEFLIQVIEDFERLPEECIALEGSDEAVVNHLVRSGRLKEGIDFLKIEDAQQGNVLHRFSAEDSFEVKEGGTVVNAMGRTVVAIHGYDNFIDSQLLVRDVIGLAGLQL
ncbi:unnamed protein product [Closterium sp. Yama58-4]|nr:unnamed protein product [Closterium sp. Yama58-4]